MNYGKSGSAKPAKGAPRFDPHKSAPKGKTDKEDPSDKAALVARMKAAAEKRKAD